MTQKPHNIHISSEYRQLLYKAKRAFAYCVICLEQFTHAFWRIFFWTLFFCGLWMLQVPAIFEQAGLYATSAIFSAGALYFLFRDLRNFKLPREKEINRRLEIESDLHHRPISEKDDVPSSAARPETWQLWVMEKKRRERAINNVKFTRWSAFLSDKDPYGLRLIALIVFMTGIMVAGPHASNRIIQGLIPLDWYGAQSNLPPVIVTITPPEYTGLAEKVLQTTGDIKDTVDIPVGSQIRILMANALMHPYIVTQGEKRALDAVEDGGFESEWTLELPENYAEDDVYTLKVKQFFFSNYGLRYRIIPDHYPQIVFQDLTEKERTDLEDKHKAALGNIQAKAFMQDLEEGEVQGPRLADGSKPGHALKEPPPVPSNKEPKILADGQVQFPLSIQDDYGVKTLTMRLRLDPLVSDAPLGFEEEQERSVMSPAGQDFKISPVYDFTHNPWAGLPVKIELIVTDQTGQQSKLEPVTLILPEREFKHPLSRQIIALRKELAWSPISAARLVQNELEKIAAFPQDFEDDIVVFLSLRVAAARLHYSAANQDAGFKHTRAVMSLLWDTALRIEDGDLSIAARNLRYANMALESALRNPEITDEQISTLMAEMKEAMAQYLSEFEKELRKRFAEGEELLLTPDMLTELMDPESLSRFLDQMEMEMHDKNTGKAQEMLSQLQRMLDMLNPNMALPMPEDMQFMSESVSELQQLIDRQGELLTQTEDQKDDYERLTEEKDFGSLLPPNIELFMQWGLENLPPPPSNKDRPQPKPALDTKLNRAEQEALRYVLGQLLLDADAYLGKIPEKMGLAEREMFSSSNNLEISRPDQSIPHQEQAIEYLSEAQKEMQDELSKRMEEMAGGDPGEGQPGGGFGQRFGQAPGGQYDPLGRPIGPGQEGGDKNGPFPDSNVKIPDEAERKRVEEILRILRDRSGELFRQREELDYFRRLLRQF